MKVSGKSRAWLLLGVALVLVLVAFIATRANEHKSSTGSPAATSSVAKTTAPKPGARPPVSEQLAKVPGVPDQAYRTLTEIDAGRWPGSANSPGTHGGDTWNNRDGQLPRTDSSGKRINYQEWDVNPKIPGQTRDAQRIITGSDGSAYYTGDHYKTFTRMR
ncbi:ribonuclease domain-containing protein [Nocardia sp. NPDC088792]|uniref:ribonuclease domain-containing protein n=1 Tax=Nocardia sp. NPDC088792 TaxID=3364332 RepID=UPI0037F644E9